MRRIPVIGAALALILAMASCTTPPTFDWPQFRHDAAGTGIAVGEKAISKTTVSGLTLDFSAALPNATPSYPTSTPPPSIAHGRVYVTTRDALLVFDAYGNEGCAGAPKQCAPVWTAPLFGAGSNLSHPRSPAVVGTTVLVSSLHSTAGQSKTEAFDALGVEGCTGAPKVCASLWSTVLSPISAPPIVAGTTLFTNDAANRLAAYDATGRQGCSGVPKMCTPLWTSSVDLAYGNLSASGSTVLSVPRAYSPSGRIFAFDAAGQQGCTGTPRVCEPLWRSPILPSGKRGYATVADGRVYAPLIGDNSPAYAEVWVYDEAGASGCSGTPLVCQPMWVNRLPGQFENGPSFLDTGPAVANGRVYAHAPWELTMEGGSQTGFGVFDADGLEGCDGTPIVCLPLWYGKGDSPFPAIANGVAISATVATDATGEQNCAGTPKICEPIWSGGTQAGSSAISNGRVYSVVGTVIGTAIGALRISAGCDGGE